MTLEEIKECFQRELKEENNMLNKTIREDHKFERERRNRHKRYYIRRISSYYDRVFKNYGKLKVDLLFLDLRNAEDLVNKIMKKDIPSKRVSAVNYSATQFFKSLEAFVYVAKDDIRKMEDVLDNPRIDDKFINVVNLCKNQISSYIFDTNGLISIYNITNRQNRQSIQECMNAIEEEVNFLREEIE